MIKINNSSDKVSVIIPAYNEEKSISDVIAQIKAQDYEGEIELIVVDNASTDKTGALAAAAGARVIVENQKGTRFSYDRGMREAKGDILVVTNGDVILPTNWLSSILHYYSEPAVVGVGTQIKFFNCPSYINYIWKIFHNINKVLVVFGYNGGVMGFWGASMSSRRSVFEKVGGINHGSNSNEDMIYTRLISQFGKVVYTYDCVVELDGRRFNQGFFGAARNWFKGIGINSIILGLTGKSLVKDFADIRPESGKLS